MHDRYVNVLPEHYREVLHINAKEKRFGLLMNIAALLVLVVVLAVAVPLIGRQNILADAETSLARTSLILLGLWSRCFSISSCTNWCTALSTIC